MSCQLVTLLSLAWGVGVLFSSLADSAVAVWVTMLLLAVNFSVSLWTLFKEKRLLLFLNLAQIGLFGILNFQVYHSWGAHHYHSDRAPNVWTWTEFTVAHVVRAADLLDFVEGYGIDLNQLKHQGTFSGLVLVAMHLTVGFFLVSVLVRWGLHAWKKLRQKLLEVAHTPAQRKELASRWVQSLKTGQWRCFSACLALVVLLAIWQQWTAADWFLWPADNVLRTLDVGGAMGIFAWKLHGVETGLVTATLGLFFRLLLGLYLVRWIRTVHMRALGHQALLPLHEFIADLGSEEESVRLAAALALGKLGNQAGAAVPALVGALADESWKVGDAGRWALGEIGAPPPETIPDLISKLGENNWAVRRAAAFALGLMGPDGVPAIPALVELLAERDRELQALAQKSLARIHPYWYLDRTAWPAIPTLIDKLEHPDRQVQQAAAAVLGQLGEGAYGAVPALLRKLTTRDEYVGLSARLALDQIDPGWRHGVRMLEPVEVQVTATFPGTSPVLPLLPNRAPVHEDR
jgi:hypothetical protein